MLINRVAFFLSVISLSLAACGAGNIAGNFPASSQKSDAASDQASGGQTPTPPNTPPAEIPPEQTPGRTLTSPETDPLFSQLPSGKLLSSIKVSGSSLTLTKGTGTAFSSANKNEYLNIKQESQQNPNSNIYWAFMNLDTHQLMGRSLNANKKIFGASSSKIYVGSALVTLQQGALSSSQLQKMADMLVVSSNTAWTALQMEVGGGNSDRGREYIYNFTQRLGHPLTRGFQGTWGSLHGNELVALESVDFLYDMYTQEFPGAEIVWKLMYTGRTGSSRGKKYIPKTIFVGGKTGTYSGPTVNPETGGNYNVNIHNHILTFNINGIQYGLVVFSNNSTDEKVALLVGGLIREYAGI